MNIKKPVFLLIFLVLAAGVALGASLLNKPKAPAGVIAQTVSVQPSASAEPANTQGTSAPIISPSAPAAAPSPEAAAPSPSASPQTSYSIPPIKSPGVIVTEAGTLLYTNESAGFSLEFPADWKDKFLVREWASGTDFYSKKVREDYQIYGGRLFGINFLEGDLYTKESIGNSFAHATLAAQGNGYSYVATFPTDVQYPIDEDKAVSDEYRVLEKEIKDIYKNMKLLKKAPPPALNAEFKYIGGDLFSCEIPKAWEVKYDEDSTFVWKFYSHKDVIGSIEMIPYGAEKPSGDEKTFREYVLNKNKLGDVKITLSKDKTDRSILDKIKNSVKIGRSFGTLYYLSQANSYIEQGGEKVFGMVESVWFRTISIRLMKYVKDESTKGYHIEDLKKTVEYPPQMMVGFIMLAAPEYKHYSPYSDPLYPPNSHVDRLNSTYFDFIIYKGSPVLAFERYLP